MERLVLKIYNANHKMACIAMVQIDARKFDFKFIMSHLCCTLFCKSRKKLWLMTEFIFLDAQAHISGLEQHAVNKPNFKQNLVKIFNFFK